MPLSRSKIEHPPLSRAIRAAKADWLAVGAFSFGINALMLTGPIFMLQVYDRVLTSRSIPTLTVLWVLMGALFAFLALFTFFRTRLLSRVGFRIDTELMNGAQKLRVLQGLTVGRAKAHPIQDLTRVRQFIGSSGITSFFDLPWTPIFIGVVFYIHFWLGLLTVAGVIFITLFTIASEVLTKGPIQEASRWDIEGSSLSESAQKNAESIVSMGMMNNVLSSWEGLRRNSLGESQRAANATETFSSLTKGVRLFLQSSILGLGAYLAVYQLITPGMMIAASIIGGRALSPIDQVIANWRNFVSSRQAYGRLNTLMEGFGDAKDMIALPNPEGHLDVQSLFKSKPSGEGEAILQGLQFSLKPGDALGVVGPSASGKSSLARLLVGIWMPDRGSVRLDGATFDQWDTEELGKHIGYLPQNAALLHGTIKANISRFDPDAKDEDVIAAAKMADVHHLVTGLPGGYEAIVNETVVLSGGQTQRIALARALYGNPALIVLDEPNSNLDAEGDAALTRAITALKEVGKTSIIMAHRPSAIAAVNKVLMIREGRQIEFGDKAEVLQKITKQSNLQTSRAEILPSKSVKAPDSTIQIKAK